MNWIQFPKNDFVYLLIKLDVLSVRFTFGLDVVDLIFPCFLNHFSRIFCDYFFLFDSKTNNVYHCAFSLFGCVCVIEKKSNFE